MNSKIIKALSGCWIEAECPKRRSPSFEAEYKSMTTTIPNLGDDYRNQEKKQGLQLNCYFNGTPQLIADIEKLGFSVTRHKKHYLSNTYTHRVRKNAFVWSIIKAGLRLGKN